MKSELAFVLHTRPFRETSLLVDLFTRSYGRLRAVSKGSRGRKRAVQLNAYTQFLVSWSGKSDLKTLTHVEQSSVPILLEGDSLFCGSYLNEILIRLLAENDPHEIIYDNYINVLSQLAGKSPITGSLRNFEFSLLEELGYGINLTTDAELNEPIVNDKEYFYMPNLGFQTKKNGNAAYSQKYLFRGSDILAFRNGDFFSAPLAAKKLSRLALEPHLGEKPILSRSFFNKKS